MGIELWLSFVAAAALVLMIPGPTVATVAGLSFVQGRRTACILAVTVATGHATILILLAVGFGEILEQYPAALVLMQVGGAAYLVYAMLSMASRFWRRYRKIDNTKFDKLSRVSILEAIRHTYFVTLLNPNTLVFFVALLPQFISPAHSAKEQLFLMSATFVGLSAINSAAYGLSASVAARRAGVYKARVLAG